MGKTYKDRKNIRYFDKEPIDRADKSLERCIRKKGTEKWLDHEERDEQFLYDLETELED